MSDKRVAVGKKRRFDVFKRDLFTCQYCGQRPPAVVLEVDHIVAVAKGGSSDDHNLITACFDCNRGKAAGSLTVRPIDAAEKARILRERAEQVQAYDDLLREQRDTQESAIDEVIAVYEDAFEGWTLNDRTRASIRHFLTKLPPVLVIEAMELACGRVNSDRAFRYFCGVCWNKIRDTTG